MTFTNLVWLYILIALGSAFWLLLCWIDHDLDGWDD